MVFLIKCDQIKAIFRVKRMDNIAQKGYIFYLLIKFYLRFEYNLFNKIFFFII